MKAWGYLLSAALLAGAFLAGRWTKPCGAPETLRRDTVILRDTLAVPVPTPERVEVIRRDTCLLPLAVPFAQPAVAAHTPDAAGSVPKGNAGRLDAPDAIRGESPVLTRCTASLLRAVDSLRVPVVVPIERRVYVTADYRAEVEGYRPRLVSMELYRQTQVVTETPAARPQRWGVGIQAGYGLAPRTGRFEPYIGLGIQYSIWQW